MSDETKRMLKLCSENDFLDKLEHYVDFHIPKPIKNALKLNCYDSAISLSKFDERSTGEMEMFMRNNFNIKMIPQDEDVADYLGIFKDSQTSFIFLSGQTRLIKTLADACHSLYGEQSLPPATPETQTPEQIRHSAGKLLGKSAVIMR